MPATSLSKHISFLNGSSTMITEYPIFMFYSEIIAHVKHNKSSEFYNINMFYQAAFSIFFDNKDLKTVSVQHRIFLSTTHYFLL